MTYTDAQGRPEIVPGTWFGSGQATWRHLQVGPAGDDADEATDAEAPATGDPGRIPLPAPTSAAGAVKE